MDQYHKIKTVYKRDPENNFKTLLIGEFSIPEFGYLKDNIWVWTEKVDGTNIRVMWQDRMLKFGGKTDKAQIPPFLLDCLREKFLPLDFERIFGETNICLYGEGYGAKIQKGGKYKADGQDFVLFDIKIDHWWLQRKDVGELGAELDLTVAPFVGMGTLKEMANFVEIGFESNWGKFPAEGVVARPFYELKTRSGHRIITKIKGKDFQEEKTNAKDN